MERKNNFIFTSAEIENDWLERHKEYLSSLQTIVKYNEDVSILECYKTRNSSLSGFGGVVKYSNTHNNNIKNKGVLELLALKTIDIKPNEYYIKISGRYRFVDNSFYTTIKNTNYDIVCKMDSVGQVYTFLFYVKGSVLIDFLNNVDLDFIEKNMINIEYVFSQYVKNKNVLYLKFLGLYAPIFGVGNRDCVYV
jgi:hypothetical protein